MSQYTPPNDESGQYGDPRQYGERTGYAGRSQYAGQGRAGSSQGHTGSTGQPEPVAEMTVSEPTLRWVSVTHPDRPVTIGEADYVLDSYFDPQYGTWEALVLVQPAETEDEEE